MPTYEYACRGCGQHLEVVQSFKDDALTQCPSCEGELRKVFSAAGIIFKGSGWHVKDYAGNGKAGSSSDGDRSSTSSDGGSEGAKTSSKDSDSSSGSSSSSEGSSAEGAKSTSSKGSSTSSTSDAKSA
ncbi:MAG: FmdB family zinc ribbon protein [Nitriliruptor sp.]|uniref:FmdB family zinc ribbon protein n=1 Tax=Nitriliruptor sp. TaxID=2448056 RepID=UPI0034A042DC